MSLKSIQEQIELAEVYKYTCALEVEKNKRQNGIFHDFSDVDHFHNKQMHFYDKHIQRLHKKRLDTIGRTFNFISSGVFVISFVILFNLI